MSVKSKVKRCNKEIKKLEDMLQTERLSNSELREKINNQINNSFIISGTLEKSINIYVL